MTGMWRLVRLILRLDRVKLPVWFFAIFGMMGTSAVALGDLYDTYEKQLQYVMTTAPSTVGRAFAGIPNGVSLGSVTMVELFNFTAVLVAFMSTLLVVRHTRKPEETGAAELIGSGIVGRYASLSAAMVTAIGANIIVGGLMWFALSANSQLGVLGSFGFSAALACTGIAFAGIAGIAAQLSETSRGANSIAGGAIGVAFLLRAVGDGFATVAADGLSATPLWVSWLSPFGWGFQIHPFTDQNWALFGLLIGFMVATVIGSFIILRHRDVGLGIIPSKLGRNRARPYLLSTWGLSWRLQRGALIGWGIGFAVFGLITGGMAHEFSDLISSNPEMADILLAMGGEGTSITDSFFAAMFNFAGITAVGFAIQSLSKARNEESSGYLESLLGTTLSRGAWLTSHLIVSFAGVVVLMTVMGSVSGLVNMFAAGGDLASVGRLTLAALAQLPALLVFIGGLTLLFGIIPRLASALSWAAFVGSFLILQLGAILQLPDWAMQLSPFTHLPAAPVQPIQISTFVVMGLISIAMLAAGYIGFWRRDLATTS